MTSQEITLVKESFVKIAPVAEPAAALFYARLFELDPSLRPLFRGDMAEQGRKLMAMIGATVKALDQLDAIVPTIQKLGARHAGQGVRDEHYVSIGAALLWTLEKGLGPDFTPDVKMAWFKAYALLSATMRDAARVAV
jgi:hemoglobin-like flavoprotein